jgi:hypothetical protein
MPNLGARDAMLGPPLHGVTLRRSTLFSRTWPTNGQLTHVEHLTSEHRKLYTDQLMRKPAGLAAPCLIPLFAAAPLTACGSPHPDPDHACLSSISARPVSGMDSRQIPGNPPMPGNGDRTRYLHMFDKLVVARKFVLCSAPPVMLFCEVRVHENDLPTNGTRKDALRRMSARPNFWRYMVFICQNPQIHGGVVNPWLCDPHETLQYPRSQLQNRPCFIRANCMISTVNLTASHCMSL